MCSDLRAFHQLTYLIRRDNQVILTFFILYQHIFVICTLPTICVTEIRIMKVSNIHVFILQSQVSSTYSIMSKSLGDIEDEDELHKMVSTGSRYLL